MALYTEYLKENGKTKCPHCKACITCGTKRVTASDGSAVCSQCKDRFERKIKNSQ